VAVDQYGYVTSANARDLGVPVVELGKLAARGRLERVSQGLYRFPRWPVSANDSLMEAVLWTRDPSAALSHDTALDVYELSDINPDKIQVTIPVRVKKLRRIDASPALVVHYQDLADDQIGWWEGIPAVTVGTAIDQCIASGVRPDLVSQAIAAARAEGRIDEATAGRQRLELAGAEQAEDNSDRTLAAERLGGSSPDEPGDAVRARLSQKRAGRQRA
jgi:predicted transcriptional regulator of viral defense system